MKHVSFHMSKTVIISYSHVKVMIYVQLYLLNGTVWLICLKNSLMPFPCPGRVVASFKNTNLFFLLFCMLIRTDIIVTIHDHMKRWNIFVLSNVLGYGGLVKILYVKKLVHNHIEVLHGLACPLRRNLLIFSLIQNCSCWLFYHYLIGWCVDHGPRHPCSIATQLKLCM